MKKAICLLKGIIKKFIPKSCLIKRSGIKYINKSEIDEKIEDIGNISGISEEKRTPRLIVSLTSYPARMDDLKYALYSLLNQTLKPDKIILWLSYEEFPDKESSISKDILNFKKNGLTIKFCNNIKSYNKLIPALREYPNDIIVTFDDDIYYETNRLERLYNSYLENTKYIHSHRVSKVLFYKNKDIKPWSLWKRGILWSEVNPSCLNTIVGFCGVLYPPNSLYKDVFNEELILKLSPEADDIWFWAMAVLQGTKINLVKENMNTVVYINPEQELGLTGTALSTSNVGQNKNDVQMKAIVEYYKLNEKLIEDE